MRLCLFLIFIYLPTLIFAQFDMSNHFEQNATLTQDEFLERFPYKTYLKAVLLQILKHCKFTAVSSTVQILCDLVWATNFCMPWVIIF